MDEIQEILDSLVGRTIEDCGVDITGDFYIMLDNDDTLYVGQDDDGEIFICYGERELDD